MKMFETRICKEDLGKINEVLLSGNIGFGENVSLFENKFASFSNKKFNIATNSASASAFMIFSYLKEKYGVCDVYTTSLGFTSPAWAAKHFGHNLIFVDVDDNLQFSIKDYKKQRQLRRDKLRDVFWESNPRVVMPVLYGGVSNIEGFDAFYKEKCDDEIVVVDSAHCVTPTIKSDFIFFSFHPYKPICTSDGGMISTDDPGADEYFRSYRNFGRQQGEGSYDIVQEGFKFYMNNLNATMGLVQLDRYEDSLKIRQENYFKMLDKFEGCLLPHNKKSSFYFATALTIKANDVILNNRLARHYPMLHKTSYFSNGQILPNLELVHSSILNLPLHTEFKL